MEGTDGDLVNPEVPSEGAAAPGSQTVEWRLVAQIGLPWEGHSWKASCLGLPRAAGSASAHLSSITKEHLFLAEVFLGGAQAVTLRGRGEGVIALSGPGPSLSSESRL